jgi:hypothetical protein
MVDAELGDEKLDMILKLIKFFIECQHNYDYGADREIKSLPGKRVQKS